MFGQTDDNQAGGSASATQTPSMLDNVSAQDFQQQSPTAQQQAPAPQSFAQPTPQFDPQYQQQAPEPLHQLTSDNPFAQNPIVPDTNDPTPQNTAPEPTSFGTFANFDSSEPAVSNSGPVAPPLVLPSDDPTDEAPTSEVKPVAQPAPVDQAKLADMKQQALSHLEPLADHLDGTPEETFKTTMMMIQANDNHTLLEKALNAAKEIEDDKARAQAMLDIVNEINYFSQDN